MNILLTIVFLFICFLQASYQAKRFKQQKAISHPGKLWIYNCFIAGITLLFMWGRWETFIQSYHYLYEIPVIAGAARLAWFDPILNWLRKNHLWYNGTRGTDSKGSWIDRLENKLSDSWVKVLKVGYVVIWLAIIIWL